MKQFFAILCLLLAVGLTATAQNRQLILRKGDYRTDGNLVVTNDSLLQRIRNERFETIRLETPHNGFKMLKSHYWKDSSEESSDYDGTFEVDRNGLVSLRDGNRMSVYQRWVADYLFLNADEMIEINVRLKNIGMYYPRGEDDTATTHPYPASAIAFDYADEEYYIPLSDSVEWKYDEISLRDSVHIAISIQRDRQGPLGESPYAEVVAMERIHVPGEVDTIGRFVCYNGDTIYFTNKEANWEVFHYSVGDHPTLNPDKDNIGTLRILHLREPLAVKMMGVFFKYVQYYERGIRMWTVKYYRTQPKDPNVQDAWPPSEPGTIYLKEQEY
ncbi:MAG: hypothetical protein IJ634_04680 [Bacteroidales bacterium]|nr:hypothetical protein [Bacteroidales bacterium]